MNDGTEAPCTEVWGISALPLPPKNHLSVLGMSFWDMASLPFWVVFFAAGQSRGLAC